jgi:WXG100 family type VII secretion target
MNQAVVDPEQLRQFAGHLHRFAEEMKQRSSGLASQMNQLEQTWRDEQQRKFAEEFTTQMRQMTRLIQTTEQHVPYLMRKAEQIDAYLGR